MDDVQKEIGDWRDRVVRRVHVRLQQVGGRDVERLHLGVTLRPADELVMELGIRFQGGDLDARLALDELQRHRADAGADLEDAVSEVGDELVGDPPEEVIGLGEPFQLDVGPE